VVIAAITSCTNTSNPSVMMAAGLLAKKAVEKGLTVKPWVKTSLAPGSQVVAEYYEKSGLQKSLDALGFNLVGFGCTTCIGNSGPLPEEISEAINKNDLVAAAVLSGNRNFEGRVNADVRANYLASPPLVVAYAIAGSMQIDVAKRRSAPTRRAARSICATSGRRAARSRRSSARTSTSRCSRANTATCSRATPTGARSRSRAADLQVGRPFHLRAEPALFRRHAEAQPADRGHRRRARPRPVPRFDHDRPHLAGRIDQGGKPGRRISARPSGPPKDFNQYGTRRGNHQVMMRGTFANIRIKNQMVPGVEGGFTIHYPSKQRMTIYDAAMRYKSENVPLVVFAGKEYGTGSSRDWAAKGTILLGVRAVIAQSFERIHRSNLVGMGVVPLVFEEGTSWQTLGLKGDEQVTIRGLHGDLKPHQRLLAEIIAPTAASSACR
jgi:aconitate hydratase